MDTKPPRTLPFNLIDLILAFTPKAPLQVTTLLSLFNVLPYRLVPAATQSIVKSALILSASTADPYLNAHNLAHFATDATLAGVVGCLSRVLTRLPGRNVLVRCLVEQLCRFGRLPALELMRSESIDLTKCWPLALEQAAAGGHFEVLRWVLDCATQDRIDAAVVLSAAQSATKGGHIAILDALVDVQDTWLETVNASTMFAAAAESGNFQILEWWKSRLPLTPESFPASTWTVASRTGHVNVLDWAVQQGLSLPTSSTDCLIAASKHGKTHVLDWWLHKKGYLDCSVSALRSATLNEHVHVLDWWARAGEIPVVQELLAYARDTKNPAMCAWWKNCPTFRKMSAYKGKADLPFTKVAYPVSLASFGHADALMKCLVQQTRPTQGVRSAAHYALTSGHVHVLERLKVEHAFMPSTSARLQTFAEYAATFGHVGALCWLLTSFPSLAKDADWLLPVKAAMANGHVHVLDWLWVNGHFVSDLQRLAPFTCNVDNPDVLDWFMSRGATLSGSWAAIVQQAASRGHIQALEWLEQQDNMQLPRTTRWVDQASKNGHWAVLEFLSHETLGQFLWTEYAIREAVKGSHRHVVKWWLKSGKVKDQELLSLLKGAQESSS